MNFFLPIIAVLCGMVMAVACVIAGAWITFKAKAQPGDTFIREPKGDVFTIAEEGLEEASGEPTGDEKGVLKRTEQFLGMLGGSNGR